MPDSVKDQQQAFVASSRQIPLLVLVLVLSSPVFHTIHPSLLQQSNFSDFTTDLPNKWTFL